ncbi:MAG: cytochrome d ubiquinol oxidase subunit II [Planctomycetes bacterium]|nr:cytochrome d ubiquinol oxidase subunit II [Planctomycetota bacterium]
MLDHDLLAQIWFVLLGGLLTGYAILDGFDFGVGMAHLVIPRSDRERRLAMNAIGPLWDGNEVWLVAFGGALFAAFPGAYATVFSGFYLALMLLLFLLIFRAVSLEFRSKLEAPAWRWIWDVAFAVGSIGAPLVFGVAAGNLLSGIPLDARGEYTGTFLELFHPYALLVGVFALSLTMLHGVLYLHLKTEGELEQRCRQWVGPLLGIFVVLSVVTAVVTLLAVPGARAGFATSPAVWAGVGVGVLAIAGIPWALRRGRAFLGFLGSSVTIAALVFLFAAALYPNLVPATDPQHSLSLFSVARSSAKTLSIMLLIAGIGMPLVLTYTAVVYWTFRGKVKLGEHSY